MDLPKGLEHLGFGFDFDQSLENVKLGQKGTAWMKMLAIRNGRGAMDLIFLTVERW